MKRVYKHCFEQTSNYLWNQKVNLIFEDYFGKGFLQNQFGHNVLNTAMGSLMRFNFMSLKRVGIAS